MLAEGRPLGITTLFIDTFRGHRTSINNGTKSESDSSESLGVNRCVLSPLPKSGTMGSNWGEAQVTGFPYHLVGKSNPHHHCIECKLVDR